MRVLLVEDDLRLARMLEAGLEDVGYKADLVDSAEKALSPACSENYDCYVVDIMLPGMDGRQFCSELRAQGVRAPILLLTTLGSTADKIAGLDSGADDSLCKPFESSEFIAHVRALLRRSKGYELPVIRIGDLLIDPNQKQVFRGMRSIDMSRKEYALLEFLARNHDHVVTRPMISHAVWDEDHLAYSNIIDVFVGTIRRKVDGEGEKKLIHTIRGKGYMLSAENH
jgi:DNA-binding response OmpR family regulator